ncbi:MAG: hypothetical protein E6J30_11930 [Chloroflexi bacterium]|nr:MAG: hypothetical protein E6J30_11930 [Chloroflexota bacterium]
MPNRTPLYDRHVALGGRMVDFGGWEMPQQYTSIRDEHLAVRKVAGLFDVSHMGRLNVEGRDAEAFLNSVVTNDVAGVQPGHAQYNLMCREDGGIIDDLVIYKSSPTDFVVVVNASNREKDVAWLRAHLPSGAAMEDRTDEVSLLAFQGPRAEELLPKETSDTRELSVTCGMRSSRPDAARACCPPGWARAMPPGSRPRCDCGATTWTRPSTRTKPASVGL